jgi:hypothetical protein
MHSTRGGGRRASNIFGRGQTVNDNMKNDYDRTTAIYVGDQSDFGHLSDDLSDDPPWYKAPRGSLQPSFPEKLIKQMSPSSIMDSDTSSSGASPDCNTSLLGEVEERDLVNSNNAPLIASMRRKSTAAGVRVHLKSQHGKHHLDIKRLSLQNSSTKIMKNKEEESISNDIEDTSAQASVRGGRRRSMNTRGSTVMRDSRIESKRESMDVRSGHRVSSMMRYRSTDFNVTDVKQALAVRDSLTCIQDEEVARLASGRVSVSHLPDEHLPELLMAAKTNNLIVLKACLQDRTTDFTIRDEMHGQTALHLAVRYGRFDIVRLLCQVRCRKMLINAVDNRHNTPLHLASVKSRRITQYLLEHGADVTKINNRNQTALGVHILTSKRDEPLMTEMLLQHQSDPNASLDQSTLLHKAIDLERYEIAYRLVRYGARLDIKDQNGRMVFDKVNRKILRQLLTKISYPPVWVPNEERDHCMLCLRKFNRLSIGIRRHHCRLCGRLCCGSCSHVSIQSGNFPKSFEEKSKKSKKKSKKRVCHTCFFVCKERSQPMESKKATNEFYQKIIGCTWDEVSD